MVGCGASTLGVFRSGMADDCVVVCPRVFDICRLCGAWMDTEGGRGRVGIRETPV